MAQAGLRFQFGESRVDTLSHLLLDWLGNDVLDNGFEILRQTTTKGQEFLDEVFHQMNVGGSNAITFHENFADATFYRNRYLSLMLQSNGTAPAVSLADSTGNTSPSNAARLVSEDGEAQWTLLGNFADHASYTYRIIGAGTASGSTLSIAILS